MEFFDQKICDTAMESTEQDKTERACRLVLLYTLGKINACSRTGRTRANPFPNKPWLLRVLSTRLLKTRWEIERLLVTSNFSFSHSVFNPFGELSVIF